MAQGGSAGQALRPTQPHGVGRFISFTRNAAAAGPASRGSARCNMPERVATTTEATMTKSTGKSSSAIDAAETKVTTAKRAVSMAAEKAPAKTAVKVAKLRRRPSRRPPRPPRRISPRRPPRPAPRRPRTSWPTQWAARARPPAAAVLVVRPRTPTMIPTASTIRWTAKAKSCRPGSRPSAAASAQQGRSQDLIARGPVSAEEYEARRNRLKQLIKLGKDRLHDLRRNQRPSADDRSTPRPSTASSAPSATWASRSMTMLPTPKRC